MPINAIAGTGEGATAHEADLQAVFEAGKLQRNVVPLQKF